MRSLAEFLVRPPVLAVLGVVCSALGVGYDTAEFTWADVVRPTGVALLVVGIMSALRR